MNREKLTLLNKREKKLEVLNSLMPEQYDEDQIKSLCRDVIKDIGATGLRDIGRTMTTLKQRYSGKMDFSVASRLITQMLKCSSNDEQTMHSSKIA